MRIEIKPLDPGSKPAMDLMAELDAYLLGIYPPDSNHLDSVEELCKPHVRFYGAFDGSDLIGCGAVKLMDQGYAEIKRIYIKPAARGAGAARALLNTLESVAADAGVNVLRVETGVRQPEALSLFEKSGYTHIGPFGDYPNDPLSVFMEKR